MSSQVRRMALGLATLTLLASLFVVVQGFVSAPEALAACQPMSGCYDQTFTQPSNWCCCSSHRFAVWLCRTCWRVNLWCEASWWNECFDYYCAGSDCWCLP